MLFSACFSSHTLVNTIRELESGMVLSTFKNGIRQYGIYLSQEHIIIQVTPDDLEAEGCKVTTVTLSEFSNDELCHCSFESSYNYQDTLRRACEAVNKSYEGVFSRLGDDFVHLCITGKKMTPDSEIFGEHLYVPFDIKAAMRTVKATHHGIGIENGYVVHFTHPENGEKNLGWKKGIDITDYNSFSQDRKVTCHEYPNLTADEDRLAARNRAINCVCFAEQFGTYNLLSNNCEHLAVWCKTGEKRSDQIAYLRQQIGLGILGALGSILTKSPAGMPFVQKAANEVARKHLKLPWKKV